MSSVSVYSNYILPVQTFNENIKDLIQSIKENELKDYIQMYLNKEFNFENIKIAEERMTDNANKEKRKGYYKQQKLDYMNYLYLFLIFVYIVFFIVSCVIMYRKNEMNVAKKVGVLFVLLLLPLVSTKVLLVILYIMQSFQKYLPKNIHMEKINFLDIKN